MSKTTDQNKTAIAALEGVSKTRTKSSVKLDAKLTANFDQVVTARVGKLELQLTSTVNRLDSEIRAGRLALEEAMRSLRKAVNKTIDKSALTSVPASLGLKLKFTDAEIKVSNDVTSTASWALVHDSGEGRNSNPITLNNFKRDLTEEETAEYFALQKRLSTLEMQLMSVRRELSQLDSKTRILRGQIAEQQLRSQGMGELLDSIETGNVLGVSADIMALIDPSTVIEHKA